MSGRPDLDDLRHRLPFYAQDIALATLGKPSSTTSREWRWGRKGSLALAIAGPKAGLWRDHECGEGGDLFALIERCRGGDFAAAAVFAADVVGGAVIKPQPMNNKAASETTPEQYQRDQHRKASYLWSQRRPITGSVAEYYLREARGITCPLPATLEYLPSSKPEHHPALIAAFSLVEEPEPGLLAAPANVQAVHLILLRPDGSAKAGTKPEPNKITVASPGCAPIVLAPANDLLGLAITEGIEDALTVHQATGLGAWAAATANRMPTLADAVPSYIECATIYAHDDEAGQDHAGELAERLSARGVEVFTEGLLP
jgi:hypothetical protein